MQSSLTVVPMSLRWIMVTLAFAACSGEATGGATLTGVARGERTNDDSDVPTTGAKPGAPYQGTAGEPGQAGNGAEAPGVSGQGGAQESAGAGGLPQGHGGESGAAGAEDGGAGGSGPVDPVPPDGDPCEPPASNYNAEHDCAAICGGDDSHLFTCECNGQSLNLSSGTESDQVFYLDPESATCYDEPGHFRIGTLGWACARITAMDPGVLVGYDDGYGGDWHSGCAIVPALGTPAAKNITWPTWVRLEVVGALGICPYTC